MDATEGPPAQALPPADESKVEWCFAVPTDGGLGEIRIRPDGAVVWSGSVPAKTISLDGISFPGQGFTPVEIVRHDVVRIDDTEPALEGTEILGKRYLFHYTKAETALTHILPKRRLRLSPFVDLNDPREAKEWLFAVVSPVGVLRPGESVEVGREISEYIKGRSRVLCFCTDGSHLRRESSDVELSETLGWTHPNMWAHYAENHRGVVLVFDRQELLTNCIATLRHRYHLHFGHVFYLPLDHPGGVTPLIIDYRAWRDRPADESARAHLERYRGWFFFTKHTDWVTEQECRIVAFGDVEQYEFLPIEGALSEIIVGMDASIETADRCRALGVEFGATVSRVFWRNGLPARIPI